ncbi:MAG TPA: DNA polymerase III subunit beta [Acidimicrobiaceae bacterium]|nr:DNA polymerase III subunit beta [Acidimicrobiaceae bacterium]HCB37913.1 DNA polymerase III subunit beta [Acidimicrobiaceae bacterium]
MKISCDREVLIRRLSVVSRAVTPRPNLLVLNGLHVVAEDGTVTITGSDLDMTIRARVDMDVAEPGTVVLPAKLATDIARALDTDEVSLSVEGDDAVISGGRSEFKVKTYAIADYPELAKVEGKGVTLDGDVLATGIRQVAGAASDDSARPILTGVLLEEHDGGMRMVATDSYRLAMCDLPAKGVLSAKQRVLVPARALDELGRVLEGAGEVTVYLGARDVTFEVADGSGTIQITTRLIEGEFPKYESLIPDEYPRRLTVDRDALTHATRRVKLMASAAVTPIRLSQRSDGVDLNVIAQDVGAAEETVDAAYTGDDLVIAFNPDYLLAGLEATMSESVTLDTLDELKPAVLRPAGRDDFLYLLMPVRIS